MNKINEQHSVGERRIFKEQFIQAIIDKDYALAESMFNESIGQYVNLHRKKKKQEVAAKMGRSPFKGASMKHYRQSVRAIRRKIKASTKVVDGPESTMRHVHEGKLEEVTLTRLIQKHLTTVKSRKQKTANKLDQHYKRLIARANKRDFFGEPGYDSARRRAIEVNKKAMELSLKEGVGKWSVKKVKSYVNPYKMDDEEVYQNDGNDASYTKYHIKKNGKTVGRLRQDDYFGSMMAKLGGKNMPELKHYGRNKKSGALSSLHAFMKSKTGKKWMARHKLNENAKMGKKK